MRSAGQPQASTAPSGGSGLHEVKSVGNTQFPDGPPLGKLAPSGGRAVREATSVGARILIVKLSSLGDVVHTLPVVQDIHAALPDAQIDWVVEKAFAPLLLRCAGVQRVIACEIRRWRKSFWRADTRREWRAFKAELQLQSYDAVIDLQGLSKSALIARLARVSAERGGKGGKRYALANQTEGSAYEAPTRWVADVAFHIAPHSHAVQRSRELAARALGYTLPDAHDRAQASPDFGLKRPVKLEYSASAAIENRADQVPLKTVVLVHGTSRTDKEWPITHWLALGQRLIDQGFQIALAHGSPKELATSQAIAQALNAGKEKGDDPAALVLPLMTVDALCDALAGSAGVIGVDSGVSHIAVALDLPHVQIYNFDTAWRTGPLHKPWQRSVFAQPTPTVDAVWQAWQTCLCHMPSASQEGLTP